MERRIHTILAAFLAAAFLPWTADGDEYFVSTVAIQVPQLSTLTIAGDISGLLNLTPDGTGESAYDAGATETSSAATILTMTTNAAWELKAALSGTWTSPGTYNKDENDLLIRITNTPTGTIQNGASSYIPLSGIDLPILSHSSAVTAENVDIQTKVLLDWTQDIPGTYSLTVLYTLVVPVV